MYFRRKQRNRKVWIYPVIVERPKYVAFKNLHIKEITVTSFDFISAVNSLTSCCRSLYHICRSRRFVQTYNRLIRSQCTMKNALNNSPAEAFLVVSFLVATSTKDIRKDSLRIYSIFLTNIAFLNVYSFYSSCGFAS